jgi:hypothetical protein
LTDLNRKIVCYKQTGDGRRIILGIDTIGENPTVVKAKLVESARKWGYFPVGGNGIVSLSPAPHLNGLGGIQIVDNDSSVSITASIGTLPPLVVNIIKDAYCCAQECSVLPR